MRTSRQWADDVRAQQAARTPEEVEASEAQFKEWLASLPRGRQPPVEKGEVQAVFYRKSPTVSKLEE